MFVIKSIGYWDIFDMPPVVTDFTTACKDWLGFALAYPDQRELQLGYVEAGLGGCFPHAGIKGIANLVGVFRPQFPFAFPTSDRGEHFRDGKLRDYETPLATQEGVQHLAFGLGYVKFRQGAGINVDAGVDVERFRRA